MQTNLLIFLYYVAGIVINLYDDLYDSENLKKVILQWVSSTNYAIILEFLKFFSISLITVAIIYNPIAVSVIGIGLFGDSLINPVSYEENYEFCGLIILILVALVTAVTHFNIIWSYSTLFDAMTICAITIWIPLVDLLLHRNVEVSHSKLFFRTIIAVAMTAIIVTNSLYNFVSNNVFFAVLPILAGYYTVSAAVQAISIFYINPSYTNQTETDTSKTSLSKT